MEIDVSALDPHLNTSKVLDDVVDGTTAYVTRNGERIAVLTRVRRAQHPANQSLLDALAAMPPHDTGWLEELQEQRQASIEAEERRLEWLFADDPHPDGPDAHAERADRRSES